MTEKYINTQSSMAVYRYMSNSSEAMKGSSPQISRYLIQKEDGEEDGGV
jgi:hypothetical protein